MAGESSILKKKKRKEKLIKFEIYLYFLQNASTIKNIFSDAANQCFVFNKDSQPHEGATCCANW